MLNVLKRFFGEERPADDSRERRGEYDIRVATCALLLEMGRIDESFTDREIETVIAILVDHYGLEPEHVDALVAEADAELERSVDYWRFARLINERYTAAEKEAVIESLWRVIYVDGKLDAQEDYLIHKLSNLLRLTHRQLIDAKLKVLRSA